MAADPHACGVCTGESAAREGEKNKVGKNYFHPTLPKIYVNPKEKGLAGADPTSNELAPYTTQGFLPYPS